MKVILETRHAHLNLYLRFYLRNVRIVVVCYIVDHCCVTFYFQLCENLKLKLIKELKMTWLRLHIARNDRWFAHLHIQNGGSKRIWILTYSWTGYFLLAWAGQFSEIKNQTMHRFEQYLKMLQLYRENSRFPTSFKFWSVSSIQKHWEKVKKCILHGFQDLKALFLQFLQSPF
jgi:hypothetical protein